MISSIWYVNIDDMRETDFDIFYNNNFKPYLRNSSGCLAAFSLGQGGIRVVLTIWSERRLLEKYENSLGYRELIEAADTSGIILGKPKKEVLQVQSELFNVTALKELNDDKNALSRLLN